MKLSQPIRYVLVGLVAAAGYLVIGGLLGQEQRLNAVTANLVAICLMHPVAFLGHRFITFEYSGPWRASIRRFAITSIATTLVSVATTTLQVRWGVPWPMALLFNCILVPAGTYVAMKLWVFASDHAEVSTSHE